MSDVLLIDSVLLILVTITAIAVVEVRSLYAAAMLSGIYSLLMALVWVNMHSMDVAFTEAAVGGGISTILILGTLVHTAREEGKERRINWGALALVGLTGAALIYGTLDMPRFGDPSAPIHHHRVPELMAQNVGFTARVPGKQHPPADFRPRKDLKLSPVLARKVVANINEQVREAKPEHHGPADGEHAHPSDDFNGHVPNTVTSLLADYRGFDTMFETTVIFTAGASLILLLRRRREEDQGSAPIANAVIVRVVGKLFIPFILIFGLYVISHGEIGPGGGFQGGVILATAFILYGLVYGRPALQKILPTRVTDFMCALGVFIYVGVGVWTMTLGGKFLDYARLPAASPGDGGPLGMTLVEWGVGITVCTVMITIFNQLAEQEQP
ncbi:MAG: Na(+)/H(+) antiporter subunit B [Myxococcales bacterium]|nr:Na(+)/H(+) antiporter subunit B [Myxococcales bacterium]